MSIYNTPQQFTPDLQDAIEREQVAEWRTEVKALAKQVDDARHFCYMKFNFFGRLLSKMRVVFTDDPNTPTAGIRADAVCMVNVHFWKRLNAAQRAFLLCHEVCHLVYLFFDRLGFKDHTLWNIAQDHVINLGLDEAGLPPIFLDEWMGKTFEPCFDEKYRGWSDDAVYADLWRMQQEMLQKQERCQCCGQPKPQGQGGQNQKQQDQNKQQDQQNQGSESGQSGDQHDQSQDQDGQGQQQGQQGPQGQDAQGQGGQGQDSQDDQSQGAQSQDGQEPGQGGTPSQQQGGGQQPGPSGSQGQQGQQQQGGGAGMPGGSQPGAPGRQQLGQGGGPCPECGQEPRTNGFGMDGGDCDVGATRKLKEEAGRGRAGQEIQTAGQWKNWVIEAAKAATQGGQAGSIPGNLKRWIDEISEPKVNWPQYLRRLVSPALRYGRSYKRLKRSTATINEALRRGGVLARNTAVALPGKSHDRPKVFVTIDVSGSIGQDDLRAMFGEIKGILDFLKAQMVVLVWDTEVRWHGKVRSFEDIELIGGGGTDVREVHRWIMENEGGYGMPKAVIHLTDMMTPFPEKKEAGPFPTFYGYITEDWRSKELEHFNPPFGTVIKIPKKVKRNNVGLVESTPTATARASTPPAAASPTPPKPPRRMGR